MNTARSIEFAQIIARIDRLFARVECERCAAYDQVHDAQCPEHPDHDPTPWCSYCGARRQEQCDCWPLAEND